MKNIYEKILEAQRETVRSALCTIVSTRGSTPRKTGAKMIVYETGKIFGTIGGGNLEKKIIENAQKAIKENNPGIFKHDLQNQHNMCCGGTVEIYIEPIMKKNKLYIFGAGHTGQALVKISLDFDFEIVLIDDRKEFLDNCIFTEVNKMHLSFQQAMLLLPFDTRTYIAILTYSHQTDRDILGFCIKKPFAYLGMIGSRRKTEITRKMFLDGGIGTGEELKKIDMPMGLEIGAETPEEIAISILASLIKTKNKHG